MLTIFIANVSLAQYQNAAETKATMRSEVHSDIEKYYQNWVGKRYWIQPPPSTEIDRAIKFYKTATKWAAGYDVTYNLKEPFFVVDTTLFDVIQYLPASGDGIFLVKFKDGTPAFLPQKTFGFWTGKPEMSEHATNDAHWMQLKKGAVLLLNSPEDILLAYEKLQDMRAHELAEQAREEAAKKRLADEKRSAQEAAERKAEAAWQKRGGVRIGMSMRQVRASNWGDPNSVNRTVSARSITEQWVYDNGYLYFADGKLTIIQTRKR